MNSASNDGKWSPFYDAMESTAEDFVSTFGDRLKNSPQGSKDEALFGSLLNSNPADRVAIANFVLDAGANAAAIEPYDNVTALHSILSDDRVRDFELEAPLLKRLLDGGANINHKSTRSGFPLEKLTQYPFDEEDLAPFYDVIFSGDYLDVDTIFSKHYGSTLGEWLIARPGWPDLTRRVREYVDRRAGGSV